MSGNDMDKTGSEFDGGAGDATNTDSVRTRLRKATHPDHVRLNCHPLLRLLTDSGLSLVSYVRILEAYGHFYRRLEMRIDTAQAGLAGAFPYGSRHKADWLAHDLARLGCPVSSPPLLPDEAWDPGPINGLGELAGILYAVEGSTLGGQVIGRHLRQNLGLTEDNGARFFNGYGPDTESRWNQFVLWLEALDSLPEEVRLAQASARKLFGLLEALLDAYQ